MSKERKELFNQIEALVETENRVALSKLLDDHRSSDIGEVIELLDNNQRRVVFDVLAKDTAAEVLEKVDEATRAELFELFEDEELASLIQELDIDDAADLLAELPEAESEELLEQMPEEDADQIKGLMQYSEDSAGGIMYPVLISVNEEATVGEAIQKLQKAEVEEDFYYVFVVDSEGKYKGDVRLRSLIVNNPYTSISKLIEMDSIPVHVNDDQEHVRNLFSKNDLIVVPVLDENGVLVGRITADRVIEVAEEEAAEDVYVMAGTDASELETYSIIRAARVRMTWLLPCLIGTGVTAIIILFFKNIFHNAQLFAIYSTAVAFTPMIAAISGNAGLQTSAIVVQGLATGDLAALKLGQVFAREARIALFVAVCCGLVGSIICGMLPFVMTASEMGDVSISATCEIAGAFFFAMFTSIMVATTLGLFLPFLFKQVGIDPAISAGPLVTTANDSISVAIYLSLTLTLTYLF